MIAGILADAVLVLHALFIAWVVAGALAVVRRPWLAWAHLPALAWAPWIEASGGLCPLTPLEVALRRAAGQDGYFGSFVEQYLGAWVYPAGLTRQAQWVLAGALAAVNVGLYAWVLRRCARRAAGPRRMR